MIRLYSIERVGIKYSFNKMRRGWCIQKHSVENDTVVIDTVYFIDELVAHGTWSDILLLCNVAA